MLSYSKVEKSNPSGSRIFSAKEQLQRKRPSRVELDSEHLFQQSLKLNNELNRLLEENKTIKKSLNKVEGVRNYKQGLIFSVENIIKEKSKEFKNEPKLSSWLVYNLKKKINQMNKLLEVKEKQIQEFSSSKIALVLKEKESQAKLLKQLAQKQFGSESPADNDILDELIEMRMYNQLQNQYILELHSNISIERLNIRKVLEEISSQKKEMEIKRQEVENSRKMEEISRMEREMEMIQMEASEAGENEEAVEELELTRNLQSEQIKDLESKIDKIIERENAEKRRLQARIEELQSKILAGEIPRKEPEVEAESDTVEETDKVEITTGPVPKLVAELKLKDVEQMGENLKYRLSIKQLTHSSWKPLITSYQEENTISIRQLIEILQQQPFGVNEADSIKLSRYLVEQKTGKYFYDQDLRQDIPIVKSILQKLISNLIVYSPEEEQKMALQVGGVTQKYHLLLVGGLETKTNKKDFVHKNLLSPVFEACSMEFTAKEIEYISFYLYGFSESLDQLMYRNLVKIGVMPIQYR